MATKPAKKTAAKTPAAKTPAAAPAVKKTAAKAKKGGAGNQEGRREKGAGA